MNKSVKMSNNLNSIPISSISKVKKIVKDRLIVNDKFPNKIKTILNQKVIFKNETRRNNEVQTAKMNVTTEIVRLEPKDEIRCLMRCNSSKLNNNSSNILKMVMRGWNGSENVENREKKENKIIFKSKNEELKGPNNNTFIKSILRTKVHIPNLIKKVIIIFNLIIQVNQIQNICDTNNTFRAYSSNKSILENYNKNSNSTNNAIDINNPSLTNEVNTQGLKKQLSSFFLNDKIQNLNKLIQQKLLSKPKSNGITKSIENNEKGSLNNINKKSNTIINIKNNINININDGSSILSNIKSKNKKKLKHRRNDFIILNKNNKEELAINNDYNVSDSDDNDCIDCNCNEDIKSIKVINDLSFDNILNNKSLNSSSNSLENDNINNKHNDSSILSIDESLINSRFIIKTRSKSGSKNRSNISKNNKTSSSASKDKSPKYKDNTYIESNENANISLNYSDKDAYRDTNRVENADKEFEMFCQEFSNKLIK